VKQIGIIFFLFVVLNKTIYINSTEFKTNIYDQYNNQVSFHYSMLNTTLYANNSKIFLNTTQAQSKNPDYVIYLNKNNSKNSINDGYIIDFSEYTSIINPKHLKFSYNILSNNPTSITSEGCDIRLTNYTQQLLQQNNSYLSNVSDPLFFRINANNTIKVNDQSFYMDSQNRTNFAGSNFFFFNEIDLFMDWDTQTIVMLFNKVLIDSTLSLSDLTFGFYHDGLQANVTKPSKVLVYNFTPNTTCVIKNLALCEDFCDLQSQNIYYNLTSGANRFYFSKYLFIVLFYSLSLF
jgi:hypothetical protein